MLRHPATWGVLVAVCAVLTWTLAYAEPGTTADDIRVVAWWASPTFGLVALIALALDARSGRSPILGWPLLAVTAAAWVGLVIALLTLEFGGTSGDADIGSGLLAMAGEAGVILGSLFSFVARAVKQQ